MDHVTVLRNGLREGVRELRRVRSLLVELKERVPVPPAEVAEEDQDAEPDPLAEMRAVVECGIQDCLDPLIRDLLGAAEYKEERG